MIYSANQINPNGWHTIVDICNSKMNSSRSIFNLLTFAKDRSFMATIERKAFRAVSLVQYYFTTITGHVAYLTTPDAILPSNIFLMLEVPFVPIIMRSAPSESAYSTIAASTDI